MFNMFSCVTRWCSTCSVVSHAGVQHVQLCHMLVFNMFSCVTRWCSTCSVLYHTLVFNMNGSASHAGVQHVQFCITRWCSTCSWRVKIFGTDGNEIRTVKGNALCDKTFTMKPLISTSRIRHKSVTAGSKPSQRLHH